MQQMCGSFYRSCEGCGPPWRGRTGGSLMYCGPIKHHKSRRLHGLHAEQRPSAQTPVWFQQRLPTILISTFPTGTFRNGVRADRRGGGAGRWSLTWLSSRHLSQIHQENEERGE